MTLHTPFEAEIARLIVESVNLETPAGEIDPTAPLYGEGLGLDSIDMLEISLAIGKQYGVALRADDEANRQIFASLRNLAQHVERHREK
ncbi:MAG: phosphopantetheine-binding protein [Burkholderiales bacterium]